MPRLIDADDIWYDLLENTGNKEHPLEWAVSQSRIDRMPTIDAVEVVRCQYCKWWDIQHPYGTLVPDAYHCKVNDHFYRANHFCAYGRRKDDET